jgi:glycosyltransferase involved in cell wall biosynthesis
MVILSFCIPTYNRGLNVYNLVHDILTKCDSINFELVVLDNCSNDDTFDLLNSIIDKRFRYIVNEQSLIGPINIIKSLTYASGKYTFLCLDKDFIDPYYIKALISKLLTMPTVAFGHCVLNLDQIYDDTFFSQGFESLYNMSYLSNHPTGMFYNTCLYKNNDFYSRISDKTLVFGFYPDIINADLAVLGPSCIIRIPIFKMESRVECERIKSHTFNSIDNLFFTPANRFKHFMTYLHHLFSLNIPKSDKVRIVKKIYRSELIAATFGYKTILTDVSICSHYYLDTRNVSFLELVKIYFYFLFSFVIAKSPMSFFDKLTVLSGQIIYHAFKMIKRIKF